jgi:DNA-binding transcriptional MocR family regulator
MAIWPPDPHNLGKPAYRALAQAALDAIAAGELKAGAQLPPQRQLAFELGLSVQTVSRAYDQLRQRGVLSGEVGRGSFIRRPADDPQTPWYKPARAEAIVDCSMLVPVTGRLHVERMAATLTEIAEAPPSSALFSFRPRATFEHYSDIALRWLARCGLRVDPGRVMPTNGATAAMTVALQTVAQPGDTIVTEEIGHHTLRSLTETLGLRLQPLEIDGEGVRPDAFARACRQGPVKALFCMPSALGPTLAMMSEARREALVAVARRHDVAIIENDAWGPLEPDRPPPITALAPERGFYVTGLSKCVLPGLRLGWLVTPETAISAARTRHLVTQWMATALIAEIATRWIAEGTAEELLRWQREALARRNAIAARMLDGVAHRRAPHGLHVWAPLPPRWTEEAFVAIARNEGVALAPGSSFNMTDRPQPPSVRVCIGAGTEDDLTRGLAIVSRLARSAPEPAHLAI